MATDAQRVDELRRAGFAPRTIAAILGVEVSVVAAILRDPSQTLPAPAAAAGAPQPFAGYTNAQGTPALGDTPPVFENVEPEPTASSDLLVPDTDLGGFRAVEACLVVGRAAITTAGVTGAGLIALTLGNLTDEAEVWLGPTIWLHTVGDAVPILPFAAALSVGEVLGLKAERSSGDVEINQIYLDLAGSVASV